MNIESYIMDNYGKTAGKKALINLVMGRLETLEGETLTKKRTRAQNLVETTLTRHYNVTYRRTLKQ